MIAQQDFRLKSSLKGFPEALESKSRGVISKHCKDWKVKLVQKAYSFTYGCSTQSSNCSNSTYKLAQGKIIFYTN